MAPTRGARRVAPATDLPRLAEGGDEGGAVVPENGVADRLEERGPVQRNRTESGLVSSVGAEKKRQIASLGF